MEIRQARPMTARTLPDDFRYPPASDAQIEEMQDLIAEYSEGDKSVATRIDWLGAFRRLLPMYWKHREDAEYWKSWQDADKIKALETENTRLIAIVQEQRAEIARLRGEPTASTGTCSGCRHQGGCGQDHWHSSQCKARKW